ncbi:MAG: hypothetical protein WCA22_00690 [Candidatus Binatus sp.]
MADDIEALRTENAALKEKLRRYETPISPDAGVLRDPKLSESEANARMRAVIKRIERDYR